MVIWRLIANVKNDKRANENFDRSNNAAGSIFVGRVLYKARIRHRGAGAVALAPTGRFRERFRK